MDRESLRAKYPQYSIYQDPDPECYACNGEGEVGPLSDGRHRPCLCACTSEPHGSAKQELLRAISNAASRSLGKKVRDGE